MEQINRIELKGNVGSIRVTDGTYGKEATLSLVTNLLYTDREGNTQVETTWHNVFAEERKGITAELLEGIKKGDHVHITGRMRNIHWTSSDGVERQGVQVYAYRIEHLEEGEEDWL